MTFKRDHRSSNEIQEIGERNPKGWDKWFITEVEQVEEKEN
jgi:hypothetical protein